MRSRPLAQTIACVLLLLSLCSCDSPQTKPSRSRNDAGQTRVRPECYAPQFECSKGCFDRKEERYCPSCCWQQLTLCDEGNPYDFKACATAETSPTTPSLPLPKKNEP